MKTIMEDGSLVDSDAPASVMPLADTARQLADLHSRFADLKPDRKTVYTAVGLAALLGAAYWLDRHMADAVPPLFDEDDEEDDEEDDGNA